MIFTQKYFHGSWKKTFELTWVKWGVVFTLCLMSSVSLTFLGTFSKVKKRVYYTLTVYSIEYSARLCKWKESSISVRKSSQEKCHKVVKNNVYTGKVSVFFSCLLSYVIIKVFCSICSFNVIFCENQFFLQYKREINHVLNAIFCGNNFV